MTPTESEPIASAAKSTVIVQSNSLQELFADWIREQLGEKVRHHPRQLTFDFYTDNQ